METTLVQKIEALLFYATAPMSHKKLASVLGVSVREIGETLQTLQEQLQGRGIVLIEKDGSVMLRTHPDTHEIIDALQKKELGAQLSKAAVETLTVVLYAGSISKPEIDYIRGVNSQFTLRNLLMRGLIEKKPNPEDRRTSLYQPTFDALSFMGITSINELPEHAALSESLENLRSEHAQQIENENAEVTESES